MEVVAEAENGRTAVALSRKFKPDMVVIDVTMPDLNGIEATRQIIAESPEVKVIALSMHTSKKFVARMLSAGASGYLLKHSAFEELGNAIHTVMDNQTYLSSKIAGVVVKDYLRHIETKASSALPALTNREREVLQLLAEGNTTKQVASLLHVSVSTIESHRKKIMNKLNLNSIAKLTKYAISEGLTSIDI